MMTELSRKTNWGEGGEVVVIPAPHFDETTAQRARPVVPLTEEGASVSHFHTIKHRPQMELLRQKWSGLVVVVAVFIISAAMAAGITLYRHRQMTPAQSPAQTIEATQAEARQEVTPDYPSAVNSAPTALKRKNHVRTARHDFSGASRSGGVTNPPLSNMYVVRYDGSQADAAPKPRLVSKYVIRQ